MQNGKILLSIIHFQLSLSPPPSTHITHKQIYQSPFPGRWCRRWGWIFWSGKFYLQVIQFYYTISDYYLLSVVLVISQYIVSNIVCCFSLMFSILIQGNIRLVLKKVLHLDILGCYQL